MFCKQKSMIPMAKTHTITNLGYTIVNKNTKYVYANEI